MNISQVIKILLNLLPVRVRKIIKHIPVLKQFQAFIFNKYLDGTEFAIAITGGPAKGLIFPVKLPQDKQMWVGTWELDFAKALQRYVKPGWVCYDIGGYKGYYAGVMALKGASEVFVFEPMPANTVKIKNLIELNPSLPICLKQYAIADITGKAQFKLMPEETMGKLETSLFQQKVEAVSELTVNCITLDELIKNGTPAPDFIKIDVEGAEELVLKGAINLLEEKKPFLMIEVHSPEIGKRCLTILEKYYDSVTVLETGLGPDKGTPEICHYIAYN